MRHKLWAKYLNREAKHIEKVFYFVLGSVIGIQLLMSLYNIYKINTVIPNPGEVSFYVWDIIFTPGGWSSIIWYLGLMLIVLMSGYLWLKEWQYHRAHLMRLKMLPGNIWEIAIAKFILMLTFALAALALEVLYILSVDALSEYFITRYPYVATNLHQILAQIQSPYFPIVDSNGFHYVTNVLKVSGFILIGFNTAILIAGPWKSIIRKITALLYLVVSVFCMVVFNWFVIDGVTSVFEQSIQGVVVFSIMVFVHGVLYKLFVHKHLGLE